jgi:hypothetical protein
MQMDEYRKRMDLEEEEDVLIRMHKAALAATMRLPRCGAVDDEYLRLKEVNHVETLILFF